MRVLLAHNRYRSFGGEERHLDLLEEGLTQAGVEVRRFERSSRDAPDRLATRIAIGVGMTYRPSAAKSIREALTAWKPDVVHVHNLLPLLTPSVLRESKHHGAAVVMTAHNVRLFCPAGTLVRRGRIHSGCIAGSSLLCGLRKARHTWTESIAYGVSIELHRRLRLVERWVDAYVAPSAFLGRLLARAGFPSERIHVIRHGVHVAERPGAARQFALYAGRLAPEKGIRTLIRASKHAPHVPIVIAGEGPLAAEVRAATNASISYEGFVPPEAVRRLRADAAFAVVPSEWPDVLTYAAVEAIAEGVPVITTDLGGLPEVARQGGGVVVAAGDDKALASAMDRMWKQSQEDPDFGSSAWKSAGRRFSLATQTQRIIDLYRHVLADRGRG